MIMTARRIDLFSNSLTDLQYIVSTRLEGITWLAQPLYSAGRLRETLFGIAELKCPARLGQTWSVWFLWFVWSIWFVWFIWFV
jgi:hypothetical protein